MHLHIYKYVFLNGKIWKTEFVESYKVLSSNPTFTEIGITENTYDFLLHKRKLGWV